MITVVIETSKYKITASRYQNGISSEGLKEEILTYWDEAHYPDNEDIGLIEKDLKQTLSLDECHIEHF